MFPGITTVAHAQSVTPEMADGLGFAVNEDDPLGARTWEGVSRDTVFQLVSRLPETYNSRPLRSLARRLLTAPSAPPTQPPPAPSLLALRLSKLNAIGDVASVESILKQVPPRYAPEEIARVRVEHAFLSGRDSEACAQVEAYKASVDPYWMNARVACLALTDKARDAVTALSPLMRDGLEDETIKVLVERLAGRRVDVPADLEITPAAVALYAKSGRLPPVPEIERMAGSPARSFAEMNLPGRLAAAEVAARQGAMTLDRLKALYEAAAAQSNPKDASDAPLARARALRLAETETNPAKKADALATAFDMAEPVGLLPVMAELAVPVLQKIPPAPALVQHAPRFARMLLLADDQNGALAWAKSLHEAAGTDPGLADQALRLSILTGLAAPDIAGPLDPAQISDWALLAGDGGQSAALLLATMQGLSDPIPSPLWDVLPPQLPLVPQPIDDALVWMRLPSAATSGRIGEALALALILTRGETIPSSEPLRLSHAVAALRQLGLEAEARRIAVEAAIMAGL
ncbi:hypothetical protein ACFSM5_01195 [Lacibacterium aquatile]|uniref:Antifreeze glycopeptide n=1 Tax=Lacibacterium aquatile TaxID=1168082 RepID=A0ABW5DLV6_9PROT